MAGGAGAACGNAQSAAAPTTLATIDVVAPSQLSACPSSTSTPLFDTSPVAIGDFIAFRPLGFMAPPIHMFPAKHSAFSMTPLGQSAVPRPVRAPGRVWLQEIWEASFSTGGANYQLFVYPCTSVRVYFGHLSTLSTRLLAEMQKVPASCNSFNDGTALVTTCRHSNMAVMLTSGETMGTGPDSAGVDFGVIDFRLSPAGFIRLDHYDSYYPYYTSPLNYFTSDVRSQIESRTGHVFGTRMRTASPIGGTYMQDIADTAQGNWFSPGRYYSNTTDLSPSLGLASDYVDPSQPLMAVGTTITGMTSGLYAYSPQSQGRTNRLFRDVRPDGQTYCYDTFLSGQSTGGLGLSRPTGVVLMDMPTSTTLRVELVAGSSCAAASRPLTSAAAMYER